LLHVQACTGLTGAPHRSDRCSPASSTSNSLSHSPSWNCPHTRLGPGHLHSRLKYTIGSVVLVLVSPLLRHSLLSLPLEAKLVIMAISPTIATMEPHKLRFRLGSGLLTWFLSTWLLNRFLLTRSLSGRSHTSEPEPGHSQHELPSTPTRFYKPSARCAPDRTQVDTKNETSTRPPYCWRRTCLSILERGSSSAGHSYCPH
jgi:hypothetical protein